MPHPLESNGAHLQALWKARKSPHSVNAATWLFGIEWKLQLALRPSSDSDMRFWVRFLRVSAGSFLFVLSSACPICPFDCLAVICFLRLSFAVCHSLATRQSFDIASFGAAIKFLILKQQEGHCRLSSARRLPLLSFRFVSVSFCHCWKRNNDSLVGSYLQLFPWISSNKVNAFWHSSKYVPHFVCLLFAGPLTRHMKYGFTYASLATLRGH